MIAAALKAAAAKARNSDNERNRSNATK